MSKIETARQAARTAVEKRGEWLMSSVPVYLKTQQMLVAMQAHKACEAAYIAAMRTAVEILNTLTSDELEAAKGTMIDCRNIGAVFGWAKVNAVAGV
jgi:hypothetical protein